MQNLFTKREYHTLESFKEIQIDNISPSARILIPLLAKDLWYSQVLEIDNKDKIVFFAHPSPKAKAEKDHAWAQKFDQLSNFQAN